MPKARTSESPKGRDSLAQGEAADEPREAEAQPWVAARRPGKSLKGRDKGCKSGHFGVAASVGLSHPLRGSRGRVRRKPRAAPGLAGLVRACPGLANPSLSGTRGDHARFRPGSLGWPGWSSIHPLRSGISFLIASLAVIACLGTLRAAQLSVEDGKAKPGTELAIGIQYAAQGAQATAVQFDLSFPGSRLTVGAQAGEAALAAGKMVAANPIDADTLRIIVSGVNQDVIADGRLALLTIAVAADAPDGDYSFLLSQLSATDPEGQAVAISALNGALTVMAIPPPLLIFPQYAEGGADGPPNQTRVVIRNNSDQADSGALHFFDSTGACQEVPVDGIQVSSVSFDLGPWSSTEIVTDGTSGTLLSGPATIHSERGAESALEATLIFTVLGDHFVSVDPAPPRARHQIYVSVNDSENTGLAVYNPGDTDATLDFSLLDASGAAQAEPLTVVLAARQQLAVFLDQAPLFEAFFQQTDDFKGTLNIAVRDEAAVALLGLIQRRDSGALIAVASSPNAAP